MFLSILFLVIGLGILVAGAEFLVRGASSLSKKANIPPIVIGLTVVAFGTSTPELTVNLVSAFSGATDIAIGNVVGSNIANILLILGASSIILPLTVQKNTTWKEIPFALLAAIILFFIGQDVLFDGAQANTLTRIDGIVLLAFFIIFLYYTWSLVKTGDATDQEVKTYPVWISLGMVVGGIAALVYGGDMLVHHATIIARMAELSDALIGLTIVAVGTSLPEFATSVVAALKKQDDIAVGNIVGSNIFNTFFILGTTALISPLPMNNALVYDLRVNIAATFLLFIFMFIHHKHKLNRWQGVLFVLLYCAYTASIIARG
jgi:cation:H+ antiporter